VQWDIASIFEHFTIATWCVATVLLVMSVLSVAVAINRALHFWRARAQSVLFAGTVAEALEAARVDDVLDASGQPRFKFSYLARLVKTGLHDARDLKRRGGLEDLSTVDSALERAAAEEGAGFRRWMTILATVSSTAPFVGLLGTVFGIINSFKGMEASESAGLAAVAGGIAEALVMTGFGLIVAIPAVWLYNWANARVEGFVIEMANSASEMHDWIKKNKAAI
jgi:biopolymer transport protein ExbB/biopolymer transport protein TolQ